MKAVRVLLLPSLCGGPCYSAFGMGNRYYAADEHRAERVNDLFDAIAPRYDLINDVQSFGVHRRWKRRLVVMAGLKPGDRALDLCCGTGDVSFALAATGAEVTGLDFSEPMLNVAEGRKLKVQSSKLNTEINPGGNLPAPSFVRGDALHTPFPDDHFDAVTISYGLRNLADFEGGLREMHRVAKPGGRLLVLDFGVPDSAAWRALYFTYLRCAVPLFGLCFLGNAAAYAYILESIRHYPAQRGVAKLMEQLGCRNVRVVNLLGGVMGINYAEK
jgi:demethylmenaquinone methyltransferase / 2-methoxy-6-polyprenyl-1,4-benzoquinol methylase